MYRLVAASVLLSITAHAQSPIQLFLAELNGTLRLSVRRFGEDGDQPLEPIIEDDLLPRNLPNSFTR